MFKLFLSKCLEYNLNGVFSINTGKVMKVTKFSGLIFKKYFNYLLLLCPLLVFLFTLPYCCFAECAGYFMKVTELQC